MNGPLRTSFFLLVLLASAGAAWAGSTATFTGPTPYLQASDSPFDGIPFEEFYLEDFEDGSLNTLGLGAFTGMVLSPGEETDSVDGDDGELDGFGNGGHSFTESNPVTGIDFTFDLKSLGYYPTHAGLVWTDGQGTITFEAFGPGGDSLGTIVGDHDDTSRFGETAEDRFYGVSDVNGIARIRITSSDGDFDIEVDHVQYGIVQDSDGDGSPDPEDCNDDDDTVFPGAPELCDGIDNDCDESVDEGNPEGGAFCSFAKEPCGAEITQCVDGVLLCVEQGEPVCDGTDTDCDGVVDECENPGFLAPFVDRDPIGPGEFNRTVGIAIDGDDNLYVTSWNGIPLQVFDENGVPLGRIGSFGDAPGQLVQPTGVTFDAFGNLYVADTIRNKVVVFGPDLGFVREWGVEGAGPGEFVSLYGVAIHPVSGDVYISDFARDVIAIFDPLGNFQTEFGAPGDGDGQFAGPNMMAFDSADDLYVCDFFNGRIQVFDETGVFQRQFSTGIGPFGVWIEPNDDVYVTDYEPSAKRYSGGGTVLEETLGYGGMEPAPYDRPEAIAVNSQGGVFIADSNLRNVFKVDGQSVVLTFGDPDLAPGDMLFPRSVLPVGDVVFVLDGLSDEIGRYDLDGNLELVFGGPGAAAGQLRGATDMDHAAGELLVADTGNDRVQVFDLEGGALREWGTLGSGPGEFDGPVSVVTDGSTVFVGDLNSRIQRFDFDGVYLGDIGVAGPGAGEFLFPSGLELDAAGNLWVVDRVLDKVLKFDSAGVFQLEFGGFGTAPGEFDGPIDVVVDSRGHLWVSDSANARVQTFDDNGGFIAELGTFGEGSDQLAGPRGLGLLPGNRVLVADSGNRRVQQLGCEQPDTWYFDFDGDGFGDDLITVDACTPPANFVGTSGDCDDDSAVSFPGASELCDGLDNDCDESIDEGLPNIGAACATGLANNCADGSLACVDGVSVCEPDFSAECTPFPVSSVIPPHGAVNVKVATKVTVTFPVAVDAPSVNTGSFFVSAPTAPGTPIPGAVTVSVDRRRASFVPATALLPGLRYTVTLTDDITSTVEGPGRAADTFLQPFTSVFTTTSMPMAATPLPEDSDETSGTLPEANSGSSVAALGDIGGPTRPDGGAIDDFITGAPGTDSMMLAESGAALIFLGSTVQAERLSPDIIFEGEGPNNRAGTSVAGGFDFNCDGNPDFAIGAELVDRRTDPPNPVPVGAGNVYVIFFDPAEYPNLGDPNTPDIVSLSSVGTAISGVKFTGVGLGDQAGFSVDGGCRVNLDLCDDLLIGAPGADPDAARVDAGRAYAVFGSPAFSGTVDLSRVFNGMADQVDGVVYEGAAAGDALGFAVACVGDVVGAAGADVALGAPFADPVPPARGVAQEDAGEVYVSEGGDVSGGIIEVCDVGVTEPGVKLQGDQTGMNLGKAIARGGDSLAEGEEDMLIGAPGYDTETAEDAGEVVQTSGDVSGGIIEVCDIGQDDTGGGAGGRGAAIYEGRRFVGAEAGDMLGTSIAGVGDVTGDGIDDIVLGAPGADVDSPARGLLMDAGRVYVVEGSLEAEGDVSGGIIEVCDVGMDTPGRQYDGDQEGQMSGSAISGVDDFDGDGDPDFGVGAPESDTAAGMDAGQVFVVLESEPDPLGLCGPDGCVVSDVDTGAQVEVPAGTLSQEEIVSVKGTVDESMAQATALDGMGFGGSGEFETDGGAGARGAFRGVAVPIGIWIPTTASAGPQLVPGEVFNVYRLDGGRWVDTGLPGTVVANPLFPDRRALFANVPDFGVYAILFPDQDDDGIRDSVDPDRDGDLVGNADDNCPDDFNPAQIDSNGNGAGDVCDPTFVQIEYFKATLTGEGVKLSWKTTIELNNFGFRILRRARGGEFEAVSEIIPAQGSELVGATYEFRDEVHAKGFRYEYLLEDIDLFGRVSQTGPVQIERRSDNRRTAFGDPPVRRAPLRP